MTLILITRKKDEQIENQQLFSDISDVKGKPLPLKLEQEANTPTHSLQGSESQGKMLAHTPDLLLICQPTPLPGVLTTLLGSVSGTKGEGVEGWVSPGSGR